MKIKLLYQCLENYKNARKIIDDNKNAIETLESLREVRSDVDVLIAKSQLIIKEAERIVKECGEIEV